MKGRDIRPDIEILRRLREGISYYGLNNSPAYKEEIDMETNDRPLQPLSDGIVLIVGMKASNLDDELRAHPRVVLWDSQQEHWTTKDLPANTRAVFMTRFVSHNAFSNIMSQVRKRKLTMFNPEGTGLIVKQIRELLNITPPVTETPTNEVIIVNKQKRVLGPHNKLAAFLPFIDFSKNNTENARILLEKGKELGIESTIGSLALWVGKQRKKVNSKKVIIPTGRKESVKLDVSVQMLDDTIRELIDIRDFLIATVEENKTLKARIDRFKSFLSGE